MTVAFSASNGAVDWAEVASKHQLVLVDFRHERDPERRQFKLIWWFRSFIDYVKQRGMAGRGREIYFVVDEITQLTGQRTGDGHSILADDLEELIAVLARNYGLVVIVAHQNLSQVDDQIRNVLMQCGTQVIGAISNPEDAEFLACQLFTYDPYKVKKMEPVWMALPVFDKHGYALGYSEERVIDYRAVEFTAEEQMLLGLAAFRLPRFHFLVRPATAEGTISNKVYRISIENLDKGQYPDTKQVAVALKFLRQKCGFPLATLLAEIQARRQAGGNSEMKQMKAQPVPAILMEETQHNHDESKPSAEQFAERKVVSPEDESEEPKQVRPHDDFWR